MLNADINENAFSKLHQKTILLKANSIKECSYTIKWNYRPTFELA